MAGLGAEYMASGDNTAEGVSVHDARPFNESDLAQFIPDPQLFPVLLQRLNDPQYRVRNGTRGKCVIFTYKVFQGHTGLRERTGSDEDVRRLSHQFSELGYEVIVRRDLTRKRTLEELEQLGGQDYSEDDSFVCWILTHGENSYLYAVDGGKLTEESFMSPFREKDSLLGKPKLFFIQACMGDRVDRGKKVAFDRADSCSPTCRIPTYADLLVAYSTVPGFLSWSDTVKGSWFVQAFCCALEKSSGSEDVLSLLTAACRLVALNYEAYTPDNADTYGAKQVPYVTSTLTRRVVLPKRRQV